jgi:hypothetical protein
MADSSTSYTQDYERTSSKSSRTATETMAIVNSSQALASGMQEAAYQYSVPLYREICRRLMLKNSPCKMARDFRMACLAEGIPSHMLNVEKWTIEPEQVVGGGNKTVQMATVGYLNQIRQNLPPAGQRVVDHMSVEAATDLPALAEEIVPLSENQPISASREKAQYATDRLLRGLPFEEPKDAIYEDYVLVWMEDLGRELDKKLKAGTATPEELAGMMNMAQHIGNFIEIIGRNEDAAEQAKARQYGALLGQLTNHLKALAQRTEEAMQAQSQGGEPGGNGAAEEMAKTAAKIESQKILAQAKADNMRESHAQRTQQRQTSWELEEQRKNQQTEADINRDGVVTRHEMMSERFKAMGEPKKEIPPEQG